jgi:hypothetical protein
MHDFDGAPFQLAESDYLVARTRVGKLGEGEVQQTWCNFATFDRVRELGSRVR